MDSISLAWESRSTAIILFAGIYLLFTGAWYWGILVIVVAVAFAVELIWRVRRYGREE